MDDARPSIPRYRAQFSFVVQMDYQCDIASVMQDMRAIRAHFFKPELQNTVRCDVKVLEFDTGDITQFHMLRDILEEF